METVYVKPAEGARVRQPNRNSRVMPDEGDHVPRNDFYQKLIISGDLIECDPPTKKRASRSHHQTPAPHGTGDNTAQET